MIDFEEELKRFHPSLEVEQVEENVYNNKPKDMSDLFQEMLKEINRLNDEIDRISQTANFNGTKLFSGFTSSQKITLHVGDSHETANQLKVTFQTMNSSSLGLHKTDPNTFVKTLGTTGFTNTAGTGANAVTIKNLDLTKSK